MTCEPAQAEGQESSKEPDALEAFGRSIKPAQGFYRAYREKGRILAQDLARLKKGLSKGRPLD